MKPIKLTLDQLAEQIQAIKQRLRDDGANVEEIHLLNHYQHVYSQTYEAQFDRYTASQIRKAQDGMSA